MVNNCNNCELKIKLKLFIFISRNSKKCSNVLYAKNKNTIFEENKKHVLLLMFVRWEVKYKILRTLKWFKFETGVVDSVLNPKVKKYMVD